MVKTSIVTKIQWSDFPATIEYLDNGEIATVESMEEVTSGRVFIVTKTNVSRKVVQNG